MTEYDKNPRLVTFRNGMPRVTQAHVETESVPIEPKAETQVEGPVVATKPTAPKLRKPVKKAFAR